MNASTGHPLVRALERGVRAALWTANAGAQAAGSVFESTGNLLSGWLDRLGKTLGGLPAAGKFLGGFCHWLGTILSAGFDLLAISICSVVNLCAYALAGVIRILAGLPGVLLAGDGRLIRQGAADLLFGTAGAILIVAAKSAALVQAVIFMQMGERLLKDHEQALLRQVYRDSLSFKNMRIIDGFAGIFSVNDRAFVLGNRMYMKKIDTTKNPASFVHECCHIWQFQHEGVRYCAEALWAQWRMKDAYDWEAEMNSGHAHWQDFNREAQAQFVQNVFECGRRLQEMSKPGVFFEADPIGPNVEYIRRGVDRTDLAREAITRIRNKGRSA